MCLLCHVLMAYIQNPDTFQPNGLHQRRNNVVLLFAEDNNSIKKTNKQCNHYVQIEINQEALAIKLSTNHGHFGVL